MTSPFAEKHQITSPVVILGIHRSGTSLLTRMLERLGLFVGDDLQGDHESNTVIAVNNFYFTSTESSWDKPYYPRQPELENNCILRLLEAKFDEIAPRFGPMTGIWGMKDPRFVVTLPLWLEIFPDMKVIHISRDSKDVALSLATRHTALVTRGIFPSDGDFWKGAIRFTQRCATIEGALSFVQEQEAVVNAMELHKNTQGYLALRYEDLLANPVRQIDQMIEFLGISPTNHQIEVAATMPKSKPR